MYENIPRNGREMIIWTKYDMACDYVHGFPDWEVNHEIYWRMKMYRTTPLTDIRTSSKHNSSEDDVSFDSKNL